MTEDGKKKCTGPCGEWKPADTKHFYKNPDSRDGLLHRCIQCIRDQKKFSVGGTRIEKICAIDGEKKCAKCGEFKPATPKYFYGNPTSPDNLQYWCILCDKRASAERPKPKVLPGRVEIRESGECGKRCTKCGECKPPTADHFFPHPSTKDKLQSRCKECNSKASTRSKKKRGFQRKYYYTKGYLT